ncbi:MAG TPA: hypothetical protein VK483_10380 [Chitinophagaceae bacterium]|nr:hypothetical protein [Chitinophagaceae bacterium]
MKIKLNKRRLIIWGIGFVVLAFIDFIVEFFLLPLWGLDNTPKNDIYFQSWWVVVGLWLLFGLKFLKYLQRKKTN